MRENKYKVSIITVCYNAENEIERTMKSVLGQTLENYEYIIVDGASSDKTMDIISCVLKLYDASKVKVISEPDKGIYDAMNKGVNMASGEWICMMNAGDQFATKNVLTEIFCKDIPNNISFLYSDFYKATSYGKYFRVQTYCNDKERFLVHQSVIYKKQLHEHYGYYVVTPQIIISDALFFLQIPVCKTQKVDTVIAKYEGSGISEQGSWCVKQMICANVVYRNKKFWGIYYEYIKWKIKHLIPLRIREKVRLLMAGVNN